MRTVLPRLSQYEYRQQQDAWRPATCDPQIRMAHARCCWWVTPCCCTASTAGSCARWSGRGLPGHRLPHRRHHVPVMLDVWAFDGYLPRAPGPGVVVLCISARHLASNATNGEGFAHSMMRMADLPGVVREAHLDMMDASAYFFAHESAWLGARTNVRAGELL